MEHNDKPRHHGQSKVHTPELDTRIQNFIKVFDCEILKVKTMTNKERLNKLYKDYGLTEDDYFKHKFYSIITRSGIDKIQAKANIDINYELTYHSPDCKIVIMKAYGSQGDRKIQTYGECNPNNNSNAYPIAMAEKRAMSRIVLKLAGFYELGAFGEDEAEDFKRKQ